MAARPTRNTARLAAILDHLPDALLLIDQAGAVVNANARAIEAFGAGGAAALVGRTLAELLPGLTPEVGGSPATWPADGTPPSRTYAHALTGSSFGVEVACSRVPWGGGEERLLVSLREGESAVEAELVRTGRAAQAVLRSTEEAVCGVDREGRVMLANPAAARLLGARVSAIAGRDLHSLAMHTRLDGTPYPPAEAPVARTLRSGRRLRRRAEIVWRQDGSPVPVEVSSAPIKDGNDVIGAVLAFSDMTETGELERRRARLVEVLANELTPALSKLTVEPDQEDLVARLRSIVADAIDYEHLMTGQAVPELTAANLHDVVSAAVAARQEAAAERSVELRVETMSVPLAADPQRLTVAVSELIRAAVAAAPAGGTVTVTVGAEPDLLRVAVDGVEQAAATENPLLRWLRPRGAAPTGADPDLALVQIVAEAHGGRFLLESKPDGVRSYVLELPPVIETTPGPRKHARNAIPESDATLVVVPEQATAPGAAHAAAPTGEATPAVGIPAQAQPTGSAPAVPENEDDATTTTAELAKLRDAAGAGAGTGSGTTDTTSAAGSAAGAGSGAGSTDAVTGAGVGAGAGGAAGAGSGAGSTDAVTGAGVGAGAGGAAGAGSGVATTDTTSAAGFASGAESGVGSTDATTGAGVGAGAGGEAGAGSGSGTTDTLTGAGVGASAGSEAGAGITMGAGTAPATADAGAASGIGASTGTPDASARASADAGASVGASHAAAAAAAGVGVGVSTSGSAGFEAGAPDAMASEPVGFAQPQVLVWPEPTPSLADVLGSRGLASVALARPEQPSIVPAGTAVVLIDPGTGPMRRKRLSELGAAVAEAALPLLAVVGLTELDAPDGASDPIAMLNCLVPSGEVGRVLIIEEDPALAAAFGAGLALAGVRGWHAKTDAEAAGRLAHARPDVVLRNLNAPAPADDAWLRPADGPPVPVLVYTTEELTEGHQHRLERGQTVIGLSPRLQNTDTDGRLATVLARLSGVRA